MLHLTPEVRDQMLAHALRERPLEACGMLSRPSAVAVVDAFHPLPNAAQSPTKFVLDPSSMLDLERELDMADREIVGVMHSHPESSPYPSLTDVADSNTYDPDGTYVQLVVSLRQPEPALRAFRIIGGDVTELRIEIFEPGPAAHDQAGAVAKVARLPRPEPSDS